MKVLEWSQHYSLILRRSRAANSVVSDRIWRNLNSSKLLWCTVLSVRMKMIHSISVHNNFPIISLWDFFSRRSRADNPAVRGRILVNFDLIRDFIIVFVTIKNEGAKYANLKTQKRNILLRRRTFFQDLVIFV